MEFSFSCSVTSCALPFGAAGGCAPEKAWRSTPATRARRAGEDAGGAATTEARRLSPAECTALARRRGSQQRDKAARRLLARQGRGRGDAKRNRRDADCVSSPVTLEWEGAWLLPYKSRPLGSIGGGGTRRLKDRALVPKTGDAGSFGASASDHTSRGPTPERFFPL